MDENNNSSLREIEKMMDLEEGTLKNVKVTINFEIDLDTLEHYLETKEKDGNDIEAIYDMICTHFAR